VCRSQSGRGRDRGVELRGTTGGFLRPPLDYPRTWPVLWLACGLAQKPQFAHTFALWLPRVRSGHSSRRRRAPAMHLAGAPPIDPTDWQHQSRPHDGPSVADATAERTFPREGAERTFPREDKRKASHPLLAQCPPLCVADWGTLSCAVRASGGEAQSPWSILVWFCP